MDPQHVMPGAPFAEETILQTYLQVPFLSPSESHLLSRLSQELIQHILGYTPLLPFIACSSRRAAGIKAAFKSGFRNDFAHVFEGALHIPTVLATDTC